VKLPIALFVARASKEFEIMIIETPKILCSKEHQMLGAIESIEVEYSYCNATVN
jgi:hypothetical protein